jgi:uncharacterized membrane protein
MLSSATQVLYDEALRLAYDLTSRRIAAMSSPTLSPTAKKNVETIAKVEQQLAGRRTRMDRIGDAIARFFGTLRFIIAHALFITGWLALNLGLFPDVQPFDPYPFPFLGLIVGIEFIFLTRVVKKVRRTLTAESGGG